MSVCGVDVADNRLDGSLALHEGASASRLRHRNEDERRFLPHIIQVAVMGTLRTLLRVIASVATQ